MSQRSAARAVSDTLREWITEGALAPGAKVSEEPLALRLGVSRNTVREAFRLLAHDGLLVHEFNRGVFVQGVTGEDVRDIYRFRRIIEPSVVGRLTGPDRHRLDGVTAALDEGLAAVAAADWGAAGTANMRFHRALVALAGSPRLDATMRRLMAELRLVFVVMQDPRALHEPFVARNRELASRMLEGDFAGAAAYLEDYLLDSEGYILAAFERQGARA